MSIPKLMEQQAAGPAEGDSVCTTIPAYPRTELNGAQDKPSVEPQANGGPLHLNVEKGARDLVAAKDRAAALKERAHLLKEKARKLAEEAQEKKRAAERARLSILRKEREQQQRDEERAASRQKERSSMEREAELPNGVIGGVMEETAPDPVLPEVSEKPPIVAGLHETRDPPAHFARLQVQVPDRVLELRMEDSFGEMGPFGEKASPAEDAAAAAMLEISMLPSPLSVSSQGFLAWGFEAPHENGSLETEGRSKRKRKPNRLYLDEDLSMEWPDWDTPRSGPDSPWNREAFPKKKLKVSAPKAATSAGKEKAPLEKKPKIKAKPGRKPGGLKVKPLPRAKRVPLEEAPPDIMDSEKAEESSCAVCQVLRRTDCGMDSAHPRCIKAVGADAAAVQGGPNSKTAAVVLMASLKLQRGTSQEAWAASREEQAERVAVWNPKTQRKLVGKESPKLRNLASWLLLHPGWEVLPGGAPESAERQALAPPQEEITEEWQRTQKSLSLLLLSWSSLRGRGDAECFGSSEQALEACRYLDPDFGPLCDLLGEGRYAHLDALLADFSRACHAVAVVRVNDFKKGRYASSIHHTSAAAFVGAAEVLIQHGSADLHRLGDSAQQGHVLRESGQIVRSAYTNKEPAKTGLWQRQPWSGSSLPALVDATAAKRSSVGRAEQGTKSKDLVFDVDLKAVDGWGIDPFTRRSILDALPKDPTLDGTTNKPRAKTVDDFVSQKLLPALNERGSSGWDVFESLKALALSAGRSRDAPLVEVLTELAQKMAETGPLCFKVHPKGTCLVCQQAGGLDPGTHALTYLPEVVLSPWKWFEVQEGLRKFSGAKQQLPNEAAGLLVEQAAESREGYAVYFVDVRSKENPLATPPLHSCQPTCLPVLRHVQGRPVVVIQTAHRVEAGQELTLKYKSYTDCEDDVLESVCLCGMPACRGSRFVHLGAGPATLVLNDVHSLPDRLALLMRSGTEPLNETDTQVVSGHGFGRFHADTDTPTWLLKWLSLTLLYVEREQELLARALQGSEHSYTKSLAAAEARQLVLVRKQHLYITLDRVRHVLASQSPDVRSQPPLRALTEEEACEYLWTGRRSVGRCLVGRLAPSLCAECTARGKERLKLSPHTTPGCEALLRVLRTPPTYAKGSLTFIHAALRQLAADIAPFQSPVCVAARDLLLFLTSTENFLRAQHYEPVTSPEISIPVDDVSFSAPESAPRESELAQKSEATCPENDDSPSENVQRLMASDQASAASSVHQNKDEKWKVENRVDQKDDVGKRESGQANVGPTMEQASVGPSCGSDSAAKPQDASEDGAGARVRSYSRTYPSSYVLAQLLFWHQNVPGLDPVAALAGELRGTCLLPEPESVTKHVAAKERGTWLEKLAADPGAAWPPQWQFKEDVMQATLGSPLLDVAFRRQTSSDVQKLQLPLKLLESMSLC